MFIICFDRACKKIRIPFAKYFCLICIRYHSTSIKPCNILLTKYVSFYTSFINGKFWYPVLKTGTGRGANEAGERMKPKVVAVKCARGVQRCIYPHRSVSKRGCICGEIKPGPRESRVAFPLPYPANSPTGGPLSPSSRSSSSPYLLARWCPSSREHKIQPGILISLPLCRTVLVPTDDFDLA